MVKAAKIAAYKIGSAVVTDRKEAEQLVRREIMRELLMEEMSFGGIVCVEDVTEGMTKIWDKLNAQVAETMRGL